MKAREGYARAWLAVLALGLAASAAAEPPIVPPLPSPPAIFRDWTLDCAQTCFIATTIRSTQAGAAPVLGLSVRRADAKALELTIATPLPLYLPDGLVLTPAESEPRPAPWFTCSAAGCEARIALDPDLLAALRRQRAASVELTLVDGTRARLPVSLMGFAAALRELEVRSDP